MADPVFAPTEAWLKARLKLSTVSDTSVDTTAIIDQAILKARLMLNGSLGATRVAAIQAYTWSETPTTNEELLLAMAATCEVDMCRQHLLRNLNARWLEGSGNARFGWDEAPLMRQQGSFEIRAELQRLEKDIQFALNVLQGDITFGNFQRGGRVSVIGPSTDPPKPGRSVWPKSTFSG